MADNFKASTILSQGGWDSTENHLFLDQNFPGGAQRLLNYEVGYYGGYRRIDGFEFWDNDFQTVDDTNAQGGILMAAIYRDIDDSEDLFVAREQKVGGVYKIYRYTGGVGWVAVATGLTHNMVGDREVVKIRFHKTVIQNQSWIIFCDGVNNPFAYDGTTWYQLTVAGAGTALSPGGNQILEAPQYVTGFENHIFMSGDFDYPGIVFHSAPNDPLDWTAASGAGQILTGYTVKQIKPFRQDLFVFGQTRIKKINVDSTTFVINDVATNIGTIASDSVLEINGDIVFLAQDGVRNVSGTDKIGDINLGSLSKQIQQFINHLQDNYDLSLLNAAVIRKKSQFRYYVQAADVDDPGTGLIGALRTVNGQAGWEWSELYGIPTSCTESDYWNGDEVIIHGDFNGNVFKQENGRTFNGTPVVSIYRTPYLTLGDILGNKVGMRVRTFVRAEGSTVLNMKVDYDWSDPNVLGPGTLGLDSTTGLVIYDSGTLYDSGATYGNTDIFPIIETNISGSFKSIRLTYTTSGDYEPHSIQGFVIDYQVDGTRGPGGP